MFFCDVTFKIQRHSWCFKIKPNIMEKIILYFNFYFHYRDSLLAFVEQIFNCLILTLDNCLNITLIVIKKGLWTFLHLFEWKFSPLWINILQNKFLLYQRYREPIRELYMIRLTFIFFRIESIKMKVKLKMKEFVEPKLKILTCGKGGKIKVWDLTRYVCSKNY